MSQLSRMVDLYTDEVIAPLLERSPQATTVPRSMAQVQLLYRRSLSVRNAGDLFRGQGAVTNTNSFESWLEHRVALATRRDIHEDKRFFTAIRDQLFGAQPDALRRATNKLLAEAGIPQPQFEQRAEVQLLLFRRWLDASYTRLRHALARTGARQDHRHQAHHDQADRRKS